MRFIDSFGLPPPIKAAIEWQESSHRPDSDISCTALIDAPLRFWLRKRYYPFIVEEYSDRLWALYGSIAHLIAERFAKASGQDFAERTAIADVLGWRVSAQSDYVIAGDALYDYKFTSVWSTAEGVKDEWESQLNVGLWMLKHDINPEGRKIAEGIKHLFICAMFRDWVPTIADKFPNKVAVLPVTLWAAKYADDFVLKRVTLHQEAIAGGDDPPPICTDKERWVRDYAIMRNDRKNALKAKIKTKEEAEKLLEELGGDWIRPAEPRRCMEYCSYGKEGFCPWWDCKSGRTRDTPVVVPLPKTDNTFTDPDHRRKDGDPM